LALAVAPVVSLLLYSQNASAQTFQISIGVRETGTSQPVGENGGTNNGIEWINLDGPVLTADNTWQQFTYNFGTDPVTSFAGATANGVLDGTKGTLEHIRIRNSSGVTDSVTIYIDDLVNTVSGTPTVVSGWETTDPHPAPDATVLTASQHMFLQPGFSGSTNAFLKNTPNNANVTVEQAHSGTQSDKIEFAFNSTVTSNWLRLTTFNGPGMPNPTIDFTAGNTLSFWLRGNVTAPTNGYIGPSGGNWNDTANWGTGTIPAGNTAVATLTPRPAPTTIIMDAATLVNGVEFDGANAYTIGGTETLTLGGQAGFQRALTIKSGQHTISAPLEIINQPSSPISGWTITTTGAADTMTTSGTITLNNPGTLDITKNGPGQWITSRLLAQGDNTVLPTSLFVNNGSVKIIAGSTVSRLHGITIAGGATPTAKLDLTNNQMIVDYPDGPSPLATLAGYIQAGRAGGAWTGNGITSTTAAADAANSGNLHKTAVGFGEASIIFPSGGSFGGEGIDGSAVLMRYTYVGDANLDGAVDSTDFTTLAAAFNQSGKSWVDGDANFDGVVNALDFNALAANFGQNLNPPTGAGLGSLIPEPMALAWVAMLAPMIRARRRRE
jgi:hypothetical protein